MKQIENKRQLILGGILAVVVAYYFIDKNSSPIDIIKTPATILSRAVSGNEGASELDEIHRIIDLASVVEVDWEKGWDRDPFFYVSPESLTAKSKSGLIDNIFGQVSEVANVSNFSLTGISWHGNSGFAIINGQIVKLEDVVGGYRVDKIAKDHVLLKQGSKTLRLALNE